MKGIRELININEQAVEDSEACDENGDPTEGDDRVLEDDVQGIIERCEEEHVEGDDHEGFIEFIEGGEGSNDKDGAERCQRDEDGTEDIVNEKRALEGEERGDAILQIDFQNFIDERHLQQIGDGYKHEWKENNQTDAKKEIVHSQLSEQEER